MPVFSYNLSATSPPPPTRASPLDPGGDFRPQTSTFERGFHPTQRTQRNERNSRKKRKLQPIGTNYVLFAAELKIKKSIVQILVRFYLLCNLWCKLNLISIISYFITCLSQLGMAAVIGLSNNDVISLRFLRSLRCVRCVGWKPPFRRKVTPLIWPGVEAIVCEIFGGEGRRGAGLR